LADPTTRGGENRGRKATMTPKDAAAAVAEPLQETRRKQSHDAKPRHQPRYQVILWNDEDHSYDYVIAMLMELFGHPAEKGHQLAVDVDTQGRAVVLTTTREHAELKRDQIHAYGRDDLTTECKGSMWATIEAMPGD
jgi:ATP-dependent Clp protease adaptor protein ClpS